AAKPGQAPAPAPGTPTAPSGPPAGNQPLLDQAQAAYDAAEAALRDGNLAEYQRQIGVVGDLIRQVRQAQGSADGPSPPTPPPA
ncbi:MAG TPA: hypothetical protein VG455_17005, partial [Acidimicrobiales bacterium]|nr:hypothetical protein [Acidimicrobiales bacterium]